MTIPDIFTRLTAAFPDAGLTLEATVPEATIVVPRESLSKLSLLLRDDRELAFDCLMCLSGVDEPQELQAVYNFYSMRHGHKVNLRVVVSKEDPKVPSVTAIWPAANWHERETFDLVGIIFEGHPDFRRILTPDDWDGHPLRKDYKQPESFHGIPLTPIFPPERAL